jgi:hypothetical protein
VLEVTNTYTNTNARIHPHLCPGTRPATGVIGTGMVQVADPTATAADRRFTLGRTRELSGLGSFPAPDPLIQPIC